MPSRPSTPSSARRWLRIDPSLGFSPRLLASGSVLAALAVAAPIAAVLWLAFTPADPQETDTLGHLFGTVLPYYTLTTAKLAATVLAVVLLIGVRAGWLVAACEFPGRRALSWMLVLPLSTPALRMAERTSEVMSIVSRRVVVRTSKISVTAMADW